MIARRQAREIQGRRTCGFLDGWTSKWPFQPKKRLDGWQVECKSSLPLFLSMVLTLPLHSWTELNGLENVPPAIVLEKRTWRSLKEEFRRTVKSFRTYCQRYGTSSLCSQGRTPWGQWAYASKQSDMYCELACGLLGCISEGSGSSRTCEVSDISLGIVWWDWLDSWIGLDWIEQDYTLKLLVDRIMLGLSEQV